MRNAIGTTWLIGLMVLFILLFVGFIILDLDYSKSIKLKNEAISIIEKNDGLNEVSIGLLNQYLSSSLYGVTGKCDTKNGMVTIYGASSLDGTVLEKVNDINKDYYYCIKKYDGVNNTKYYQLTLFYKFNLPVIGDASRFTIKGTTTNFEPQNDNYISN